MAVKLRLRREGTKKKPYFRLVAADGRSPRDGRFIEILGVYHPTEDPSRIEIDNERALYWLRNGAQPTQQVENLLRISGAWEEFKPGDAPKRVRTPKVEKKPRASDEAKQPEAQAAEDTPSTGDAPADESASAAPEEVATDTAEQDETPESAEDTAEPVAETDADAVAETDVDSDTDAAPAEDTSADEPAAETTEDDAEEDEV